MTEREKRFAEIRPELYGRLLEHVREGRIVLGQVWKASQHQLTAETLDELGAAQLELDFRALDRPERTASHPYLKSELLLFQRSVDECVLEKVQGYESRPETERREIERDFPYVDMAPLTLATRLNLLAPAQVFSAMVFPSRFAEVLTKLGEWHLKRMAAQ